jgi:hypothetical protein
MERCKRDNYRRRRTEKMKKVILILFTALLTIGCASTRAVVPLTSESAGEYRELQGEAQRRQADIAISGQKIEDQGRGLVDDLTRLEESIANAATDTVEVGRLYWLSEVRSAREGAEAHVTEIENLNRQLAESRETDRKKDQKFNEYEAIVTGQLAAKDTENAELRENIKAVTGQRNTLLAIVITAVSVILLLIAVKILRTLRIIPI